MNTDLDALLDRGQAVPPAAAELVTWYASHSIVRHLWAIEATEAIRIVVTLEPTLDGDDTQPAWLANSWTWAQELRLRLQRNVHLELINEPSARVEASCDSGDSETRVVRPIDGGSLLVRRRHSQRSLLNRTYKPRQIDSIAPTTIGYT